MQEALDGDVREMRGVIEVFGDGVLDESALKVTFQLLCEGLTFLIKSPISNRTRGCHVSSKVHNLWHNPRTVPTTCTGPQSIASSNVFLKCSRAQPQGSVGELLPPKGAGIGGDGRRQGR